LIFSNDTNLFIYLLQSNIGFAVYNDIRS